MRFLTFVPSVAVPVETADKLAAIAQLEGQTLQLVIRQALDDFAQGYNTTATPAPTGPPAR